MGARDLQLSCLISMNSNAQGLQDQLTDSICQSESAGINSCHIFKGSDAGVALGKQDQ